MSGADALDFHLPLPTTLLAHLVRTEQYHN